MQLVGWVASEVPDLRKVLLDEDPIVLLYEGDPSRLGTEEIAMGLRKMATIAATSGDWPWPTPGTVRRLARPELQDAVLALLQAYRACPRWFTNFCIWRSGGVASIVSV